MHIHSTTQQSPIDRFADEVGSLRLVVDQSRFLLAMVRERVVANTGWCRSMPIAIPCHVLIIRTGA